jgi:hypothetical protein
MSENLKNFEFNTENCKVYWGKIRSFYLSGDSGHKVMYQTDHDGPFMKIDLQKKPETK